ncbi:MAG: cysteine desulfurase [Ignavibacteria bacterium]|nr:cysteine desulfurase [Ignavibacteria bacterium]
MNEFNIHRIREDFPILTRRNFNNKQLIYFDNAATTQKPKQVIETIVNYYKNINSNVHRGVHFLSEEATTKFEEAREKVKQFINADYSEEIIFVRGTTEAINLVANSFCKNKLNENDEIIISSLEHHSNIVPWQMLCECTGAKLKVIPIDSNGDIIFEEFIKLLSEKTRLVAITHISNAIGTVNPIEEVIKTAHSKSIPVLIDGAQSIQHKKIDVKKLDCDFFAFSGHKVYGPTGIGILYGKKELLENMPPYQGGGEMIQSVSFEKTTYNTLPYKFEAGTPNIAGAVGLASALDYITQIGLDNIATYEREIFEFATEKIQDIDGIKIIGTAKEKANIISFLLNNLHPYDVGAILDNEGIAVRTGLHCAEPLMKIFSINGTVRVSLAFYNTKEEILKLVEAINKAKKLLT